MEAEDYALMDSAAWENLKNGSLVQVTKTDSAVNQTKIIAKLNLS